MFCCHPEFIVAEACVTVSPPLQRDIFFFLFSGWSPTSNHHGRKKKELHGPRDIIWKKFLRALYFFVNTDLCLLWFSVGFKISWKEGFVLIYEGLFSVSVCDRGYSHRDLYLTRMSNCVYLSSNIYIFKAPLIWETVRSFLKSLV